MVGVHSRRHSGRELHEQKTGFAKNIFLLKSHEAYAMVLWRRSDDKTGYILQVVIIILLPGSIL
jgi:hypothetical protein